MAVVFFSVLGSLIIEATHLLWGGGSGSCQVGKLIVFLRFFLVSSMPVSAGVPLLLSMGDRVVSLLVGRNYWHGHGEDNHLVLSATPRLSFSSLGFTLGLWPVQCAGTVRQNNCRHWRS